MNSNCINFLLTTFKILIKQFTSYTLSNLLHYMSSMINYSDECSHCTILNYVVLVRSTPSSRSMTYCKYLLNMGKFNVVTRIHFILDLSIGAKLCNQTWNCVDDHSIYHLQLQSCSFN